MYKTVKSMRACVIPIGMRGMVQKGRRAFSCFDAKLDFADAATLVEVIFVSVTLRYQNG